MVIFSSAKRLRTWKDYRSYGYKSALRSKKNIKLKGFAIYLCL